MAVPAYVNLVKWGYFAVAGPPTIISESLLPKAITLDGLKVFYKFHSKFPFIPNFQI